MGVVQAGRMRLIRLKHLADRGKSFGFETTLSGRFYGRRIQDWQHSRYRVYLYFLSLASVDVAIDRVRFRVAEGGHDVPVPDIQRRYERGIRNFEDLYKPIVDDWVLFDNSGIERRFDKNMNRQKHAYRNSQSHIFVIPSFCQIPRPVCAIPKRRERLAIGRAAAITPKQRKTEVKVDGTMRNPHLVCMQPQITTTQMQQASC